MLSKKQYPSIEGIKTILASLAETDPRARSAKPEDFVDMSFIRELDQSGYIDRLYTGSLEMKRSSVCALSSPPIRIPLNLRTQLITSARNVEIRGQPVGEP